jgi:hypothetical protein
MLVAYRLLNGMSGKTELPCNERSQLITVEAIGGREILNAAGPHRILLQGQEFNIYGC